MSVDWAVVTVSVVVSVAVSGSIRAAERFFRARDGAGPRPTRGQVLAPNAPPVVPTPPRRVIDVDPPEYDYFERGQAKGRGSVPPRR